MSLKVIFGVKKIVGRENFEKYIRWIYHYYQCALPMAVPPGGPAGWFHPKTKGGQRAPIDDIDKGFCASPCSSRTMSTPARITGHPPRSKWSWGVVPWRPGLVPPRRGGWLPMFNQPCRKTNRKNKRGDKGQRKQKEVKGCHIGGSWMGKMPIGTMA